MIRRLSKVPYSIIFFASLVSSCTDGFKKSNKIDSNVSSYIDMSKLVPNPDRVRVCITNPADVDPSVIQGYKARVDEEFASTVVSFKGWDACTFPDDIDKQSIRIRFSTLHAFEIPCQSDDNPKNCSTACADSKNAGKQCGTSWYTEGCGRPDRVNQVTNGCSFLGPTTATMEDRQSSMILADQNASWLTPWNQWKAVQQVEVLSTFVHELGHAIGLMHEHQRPTEETHAVDCRAQFLDPIVTPSANNNEVGAYDKDSLMNYCKESRLRDNSFLTQRDIEGIEFAYGKKLLTDDIQWIPANNTLPSKGRMHPITFSHPTRIGDTCGICRTSTGDKILVGSVCSKDGNFWCYINNSALPSYEVAVSESPDNYIWKKGIGSANLLNKVVAAEEPKDNKNPVARICRVGGILAGSAYEGEVFNQVLENVIPIMANVICHAGGKQALFRSVPTQQSVGGNWIGELFEKLDKILRKLASASIEGPNEFAQCVFEGCPSQQNDYYFDPNGELLFPVGLRLENFVIYDPHSEPSGDKPSGNGDGAANPGETIVLNFAISNRGVTNITNVKATVTSSDPSIRVIQGVADRFGNYAAFEVAKDLTGMNQNNPLFLSPDRGNIIIGISPGFISEKNITLDVLMEGISDGVPKTWRNVITIPAKAVVGPSVEKIVLYDAKNSLTTGNGNFIAEPGENVRINFVLRNSGATPLRGLRATLRSTSALATIDPNASTTENRGSAVTMNGGAVNTTTGQYMSFLGQEGPFVVQISPTAPRIGEIPLELILKDAYGHQWINQVKLPIGTQKTEPSLSIEDFSVFDNPGYDSTLVANNDQLASPGEIIRLLLSVRNRSAESLQGVTVTLASSTADASIENPTISGYGNIPGNSIRDEKKRSPDSSSSFLFGTTDGFKISISPNAKGTLIFNVTITTSTGQTFTDYVRIPLAERKLQVGALAVSDIGSALKSCVKGNSNGKAEPGEFVLVNFGLTNTGKAMIKNRRVVLSSLSNQAEVVSGRTESTAFGEIFPNMVRDSMGITPNSYLFSKAENGAFCVRIAPDTPRNSKLPMRVQVYDSLNQIWTIEQNVSLTVQ